MMHRINSYILLALIVASIGGAIGYWFGVYTSPSYYDALTIEKRLREVFCEQALHNGVLQRCKAYLEV